ncbi:MAG TPA: carotenoid oxygenase family protein [Acidimicrobiales bacterium]|nr:carotenoid oxygenase family protein [Acidimicrobiales bacterium]
MTDTTAVADPFLSGGYAPVADEVVIDDLAVTGRIPEALAGRFLRTGPNPLGAPPSPYHWFLGDGMVHGIELDGGRARSYRNRWVRTDPVADALGEARREGPAQPMYDSSNTNVVAFAGLTLSLTEGCQPYVLDAHLDTIGRADFGEPLRHGMTAHPKVDPVTGELHAFSYWWEPPWLLYHLISPEGRLLRTEAIDLPAPVSMHDFAITEHHIVFFDQPAVFDLGALATTGFPFRWTPENGARLGLLPRDGSGADVRWVDAPLGYSYHPLNAYEDGTSITVDLPLISSAHDVEGPLGGGADRWARFERWTVDLASGRLGADLLDDQAQDFSRIAPGRVGLPHRYGYTIELGNGMPYDATRTFKQDLRDGTRAEHEFGPGNHPGELSFVPDPERATDEDGGWLVGLVHHDDEERTTLVILDAQDVAGPPLAEVRISRRVPYGFHGAWVPAR